MRAFVCAAVALGAISFARPAHAQFENHSIGLDVGYIHLSPGTGFNDALGQSPHVPALALDATLYIADGFDVGLRFGLAIQHDRALTVDPTTGQPSNGNTVVVLYPAAMLRWFIWQDYFRPYIGANLEYVHAFDSSEDVEGGAVASDNYVGIGPTLGFEYFVTDDWSIGLHGEFAGYFSIGADPEYTLQLWARVATYF